MRSANRMICRRMRVTGYGIHHVTASGISPSSVVSAAYAIRAMHRPV